MMQVAVIVVAVALVVGVTGCSSSSSGRSSSADIEVGVGSARLVSRVDARFQSFNLEMATLLGGSFWAPFDDPSGQSSSIHPPVTLDAHLRNLTRALGPAYLRVSGSWANQTYFDPTSSRTEPPAGFHNVLTASRWDAINEFAEATGAKLVTSFAGSAGTRAPDGSWTPDQAEQLLRYTVEHHYPLAAAEFINEPNIPATVGAKYDAAGFARDFKTLQALRDRVDPTLQLFGPGATLALGKTTPIFNDPSGSELLQATGPLFDGFSYHFYPGVSSRCQGLDEPQVTRAQLTDPTFLAQFGTAAKRGVAAAHRSLPGKPVWVTETATAACGGDRWASTFRGAFGYVEQLAAVAQAGVDVTMHNTLIGSDYGLIDDRTGQPRPSYWAALLWNKVMGTGVLQATTSARPDVSVHVQCAAGPQSGSVGALVVNLDASRSHTVDLGSDDARSYALTAPSLDSGTAELNGTPLAADGAGNIGALTAKKVSGRSVTVAPSSINFVMLPAAASACATKPGK